MNSTHGPDEDLLVQIRGLITPISEESALIEDAIRSLIQNIASIKNERGFGSVGIVLTVFKGNITACESQKSVTSKAVNFKDNTKT